MKYNITLNGKTYEVSVERGEARVEKEYEAAVPVAAPAAAPSQIVNSAPAGANSIKAPMPGTILAVKVSPGAKVKSGEVLAVLEAMKMENDICAPSDCVISQVLVSKGQSVDTGAPLFVIG